MTQLSGFMNGGINFGEISILVPMTISPKNIISGNYGLKRKELSLYFRWIYSALNPADKATFMMVKNLDYQQAELDLSLQVATYYLMCYWLMKT